MAVRVGQLHVQYVAGVSSESDLRVTKVFAQVAVSTASGATIETVNQTIFAGADDNKVEQSGDQFHSVSNVFFDAASDNEWVYDPVYNVWIGHTLFGPAGDTTAEALYQAVSQSLFTTSHASPDEEVDVTQYLGFTDRHFETTGHSLFRTLTPVQISPAEIANCSNVIFASGTPTVARGYNVSSSLGWSQVIVQTFSLDVDDVLGLGNTLDTAANSWTRSDDPAQSSPGGGLLRQSISINVDNNDCRESEYAPIIGTGPNDEYEEFAIAAPSLTDASGVTLTYPADGTVTDTLILENPDFGNEHVNSFTRVDRPTRGGDRKIFSDPKWASWERMTMTIAGIGCGNTPTLEDIIAFLNTTLGEEIRLTDWEAREWKGIIVAPETEVIEEQGGMTVQIVFEGELTSYEVQYDEFDVIHGQHTDGTDIDVTYEV